MTKYHPLDVRYKGPSTAYRGSAHRKALERAPKQSKPKLDQGNSAGPWGGKATAAATRQPVQESATYQGAGDFFRGAMRAGRTIKNVYLAFILIVLVALVFGNPGLRTSGLSLQPQEMVPMPTR